jgi:hypothetical protein
MDVDQENCGYRTTKVNSVCLYLARLK